MGIASELARNSKPGVAETLLRAQADAPLYYQSIYTPRGEPSVLTTLLQDDTLESVRLQFANGERIGSARRNYSNTTNAAAAATIHHHQTTTTAQDQQSPSRVEESLFVLSENPDMCMKRIHDRLRHVLIRACTGSDSTMAVVNALESCLKSCFLSNQDETTTTTPLNTPTSSSYVGLDNNNTTLLEPPMVTRRTSSGHTMARFYFDASSSTGGFHRLLLHAICQFHGLNATSTTTTTTTTTISAETSEKEARLLTVTGKRMLASNLKITDCLHHYYDHQTNIVGLDSSEPIMRPCAQGEQFGDRSAPIATTTSATTTTISTIKA